jgi:hypothetical protein
METSPPNNGNVENDRPMEDRISKLGYFSMLSERYPLNTEVVACSTPESANFLALEKEYMNIPPELHFEALKDSIPPEHQARIQKIWEVVQGHREDWKNISRALKTKWNYVPESADEIAKDTVNKTRMAIRDQLKKAAVVLISKEDMSYDSSAELSRVNLWQIEEKGLREQYYDADKNYLVALRLYYEMLLERPGQGQAGDPVLPEDHPERWNIVFRNRYARLIDAAHQSISLAKAAHHSQSKKRIRKTREEPFIFHPLAVTLRFIQDVLPYVIKEPQLPMDFIKGIIITAVHDLPEDTELAVEDIIDFIKPRADKYDSGLDQVIESGFGHRRDEIKKKQLDLMRPHVLDAVRLALRIVTNGTTFTDQDEKIALQRNRLGEERTMEVLGITERGVLQEVMRRFGIQGSGETLNTVKEFPLEKDTISDKDRLKMDSLLLRIETFARTGNEVRVGENALKNRRLILCTKMGDKGHNNSQLAGRELEIQRSSLRATVSRLLAYAILDYDSSKASLYNALPRLIDETISEYERFERDFPGQIEELDIGYYKKLLEWQQTVKRYNPPELLRNTVEEWHAAHEKA